MRLMVSQSLRRRISIFMAASMLLQVLIIGFQLLKGIDPVESSVAKFTAPHRKLLLHPGKEVETNRIWGEKCSKSDIVINQGSTAPMPNGIPTYTVEVMNVCLTGCDISGIHLNCGWFGSARLINPRIFKRLHFNDCLVNDGKPLASGRTISFQYANTFRYPLSVSSVIC